MSQAGRRSHLTLNTDGRPHPRENALAIITLVLGLISVITAFWEDLHFITSVAGLLGLVIGLYDQLISATRAERIIIIPGIVAAGLGLGLGLAHGGFGL